MPVDSLLTVLVSSGGYAGCKSSGDVLSFKCTETTAFGASMAIAVVTDIVRDNVAEQRRLAT